MSAPKTAGARAPRATPAREALGAAALLAGALGAFGMTLQAGVFLDDWGYIADALLFRRPAREVLAATLGRDYFALTKERTWQPLATLLNYALMDSPAAWRLAGIALHALCAWLLRGATRRLTGSERAGWAAAALFLLFPLSADVVFFAAWRGHMLAAAAALAGLLAWLRWRDSGEARDLWACRAAFAFGLASKESGLVGLALILLHVAVYDRARWKARLAALSGHAALAAAYLGLRFLWLAPMPHVDVQRGSPPLALAWSLRALAWPWPACAFRASPGGWGAGAAALAAYAALLALARRRKELLFALLWIPVALLPVLHLVPFAVYSPVADRFLYLASAGAALGLAAALAETRARLALGVLVAVWGAGTLSRNGLYRDLPSYAEQCAECAPDHPQALAFSGTTRMAQGELSGAERRLRAAIALAPGDPLFHDQLGLALFAVGRKDEAVAEFRRATELGPGAAPWNNLGAALAGLKRYKEALAAFEEAARRDPDFAKARLNADAMRRKLRS